jgi:hypothetical protein
MRLMSKVIVAGLATVTLAGSAYAAERAIHTMNVALPDGSVAKVRYVGDQPPQVAIVPVAVRQMPVAMIDPSFAAFDRIFAAMDAQSDAMMQQAAAMARMPVAPNGQFDQAALSKLPAGTVSYSYVSTTSSDGCTQTVRTTSDGSGQPQVIRTSAGKCDGARAMPAVADGGDAPVTAVPATDTRPAQKAPDPNAI